MRSLFAALLGGLVSLMLLAGSAVAYAGDSSGNTACATARAEQLDARVKLDTGLLHAGLLDSSSDTNLLDLRTALRLATERAERDCSRD